VPTSRWIPSLDDYIDLASVALDTDPKAVRRLPRLSLAESALAAPFAAFGDVEAYPELVDQAAVLITHLVENHPLPDGNKRAGFLMLARLLEANGRRCGTADVTVDAPLVERIAAGDTSHDEVVAWIAVRTHPAGS
jgi:death-on-curing protein